MPISLFDVLQSEATGEALITEGTPAQLEQARIPPEEWPWGTLTDGKAHTMKLSELGVARYATFKRYCNLVAGQRDLLLEIDYRPKTHGDYVAVRFTPIDVPSYIKEMAVAPRQLTAGSGNGRRLVGLPGGSDAAGD
jgi:hypothetical protein